MIIIFSFLTGIMIAEYKKSQIGFIDDIVFLGERVFLLLSSTAPETEIIFNKLQNEYRLNKYDVMHIYENSPLQDNENTKIKELINTVGKFDIETQIKCTEEFLGYFKALKKQYQEYYNSHFKLYLVFGLSVGIVISLMLI